MAIDRAEVEIVPAIDASRFTRDIQSSISRAFNTVRRDVDRFARDAASSFSGVGENAGRSLEGVEDSFNEVSRTADESFNQISQDASETAREIGDDFERSGERAERAFRELKDSSDRGMRGVRDAVDRTTRVLGGGRLTRILGGITTAFAAIGAGRLLSGAVTQAADLSESINAVNVVLGEGAESFLTFGETAANNLGLTQAALNQAIVPSASLLRNAGVSGEQLSQQLQQLATRATDVGSVFNEDVNVVLEAFGAALRGETEPIRRFGVNLNQAQIQAKAVELGLIGMGEELNQQAKVQAAFALVMEQTNVAAGDFQNTIDSFPNLMRRVRATLEETSVALGAALLPAIQEVAKSLLPAIQQLTPIFEILGSALGDALTTLAPFIGLLVDQLVVALELVAPTIQPVAMAFGQVLAALAPLLPLIGQLAATLLPPLAEIIGLVAAAFAPLIVMLVGFINDVLVLLAPLLPPIVGLFGQLAGVLAEGLMSVLRLLLPLVLELLTALTPIIPVLVQLLSAVIPILEPLFRIAAVILPLLTKALLLAVPPLVTLIELLAQVLTVVIGFLVGVLNHVATFIENWRTHWNTVKNFFVFIWNTVRTFIVNVWNSIKEFILGAVTSVRDTIVGFFTSAKNQAVNRLRALRDGAVGIFNAVRDFISGRVSAIKDRLVGGFTSAKDAVLNVFRTMRTTIGNIWDGLVGVIKKPVKGLFRWINDNLIDNANRITGLFGLEIPHIPTNFHRGGVVPGQGEQVARVLGGEGWLTPRTTAALGGERGISALNSMGERGKLAQGGPLDWIEDNVLDPAGAALAAVGDQLVDWLKQGVGFAMSRLVRPLRGQIDDVAPDGFVGDFIAGIFDELTRAMESWADDRDAPDAGQSTGVAGQAGWVLPLPPGSYRVGRGPAGHGYPAWDLPAPTGTPVYSIASGIVTRALRMTTSYGIHALVSHFNGFQSRYAHLSSMMVRTGQALAQGQQIGRVGSTGNSTGPHLHIELLRNGVRTNPGVIGFDSGFGTIPSGYSLVYNGTGGPETLSRVDRAAPVLGEDGGVHFHVSVVDGPMTLQRAVNEAKLMQRTIEHLRPVA